MAKSFGLGRSRFWRWSFFLIILAVASFGSNFLLTALGRTGEIGLPGVPASAVQAVTGPVAVQGTRFTNEAGMPVFLVGVNYEGHTDRAWQMWEDDKFDAGLIDSNFWQIEVAGINVVRVFINRTLRDNLNANNWGKLDKVVDLARQHRLRLLITFNDYDEPNLAKEAEFNQKVVGRYKGNTTVFGYDLKNEPQFGDIATADFPTGVVAPLQDDAFIKSYGERMSNDQVKQWRTTSQGKTVIPARFDERRAYLYANAYKLWVEFLGESGAWVQAHSGKNTLDYINSPDGNKWDGYLDALSGTLGKYIEVRQGAIRAVNPAAVTTTGWSNIVLAKLRANENLSFVSLHRFVSEGAGGLNTTINLLENLRATFPARPVVLEEFGYSNAHSDGSGIDQNLTAGYETALWLYLYSKGFAGGFKWMLTNFPLGFNQVENNFGLLDNNTQPKPSYHGLRGVATAATEQLFDAQLDAPFIQFNGSDIEYRATGPGGFFTNARNAASGPVLIGQDGKGPFAAWWNTSGAAQLSFVAGQPTQVRVNLDQVYPQRLRNKPVRLSADGLPAGESGDATYSFTAQPGVLYRLQVPLTPSAFSPAPNQAGALYFKETGHNLSGRFRAYWEKYGGLAINGFPVSEVFNENGLYVQYFERARFEYHPENNGTRYEVLLGHLGRALTAGREGEGPFQRIPVSQNTKDRVYFSETGHSMSSGFKGYWERNGGLAQFGFPITEEFKERNPTDGKTYTVQYFERARFEYHPENAGTPYDVLLGHLGWQLIRANGWLP